MHKGHHGSPDPIDGHLLERVLGNVCSVLKPSGNTLMHVKCIHDLCTLPLDIPPYLHHILVIFVLFDDYWEYFTCSLILLN
jgi:hypothetical protein